MEDGIIGKQIDDYQIEGILGQGGMGTVYKARDVNLSRPVALKRINPSQAHRETFIHRFRSEAKALARIDSRHITSVYALRETDVGLLIVMEYVDGGTLKEVIEEHGGPVPVAEATDILEQILEAFQEAHAAGVVHRDIKPQNIMLSRDGVVKVMDFGIAKLRRPDSGETVTQGGEGGTLKYMSPEQVSSLDDVDDRSDLYAIGMTAYEMLTGTLPFQGVMTDFDIMQAIVQGQIPSPREHNPRLSPSLSTWIETATARKQDDRFQDAETMLAELRGLDRTGGAVPANYGASDHGGADHGGADHGAADPDRTQTVLDPTPPAPRSDDGPGGGDTPDATAESESADTGADAADGGLPSTTSVVATVVVVLLAVLGGGYWMFAGTADAPPARLTLTTSPAEATVRINGETAGRTPISEVALPAGALSIQIRKEGYQTVDTTLQAAPAGTSVRLTGLDLLPKKGRLSVPAPDGATVYVNGERKGVAPLTDLSTEPGRYEVRIERDGRSVVDSLSVEPGRTTAWQAADRLAAAEPSGAEERTSPSAASTPAPSSRPASNDPAPAETPAPTPEPAPTGRIEVRDASGGATLTIDGTSHAAGRTHTVRAGERAIRCRHPEFPPMEETISVAEGETTTVGCFYRQPVSVNMIGAWGNVLVDGENTGTPAPTTVRLDPGEHRIGLSVERNEALRVEGGTYRKEVGSETSSSTSFSGSDHTVTIEPSLVPIRHAVVFRVEK